MNTRLNLDAANAMPSSTPIHGVPPMLPTREKALRELRGPAALVMAPFDDDMSLNLDALRSNIQFMLDAGLKTGKGFIISPCGSGEYTSLSPSEHQDMVRVSVEAADGCLPVVAGATSLNLDDVIALSQAAIDVGAEYVMVAPPCYHPISQDSMFDWYQIITESIDAGVMIYDQSWRQELGTSLGVELIGRLAELPGIVALKYGAPNIIEPMVEALERFSDRFAFIDNSLGYTSTVAHMHGATGFISGPSTWWPEFELEFFQLLESGDFAGAERWHARIGPYMDLHHGAGGEFSGQGDPGWQGLQDAAIIKAAMDYVGLHGGPSRAPFHAVDDVQRELIHGVLERLGVRRAVSA